MANNKKMIRSQEWRDKIKIGVLVDRLNSNALGILKDNTGAYTEMTSGQIKSAEILLKKTIPDLKSIEHKGENGGAIQQSLTVRYVDGKDE